MHQVPRIALVSKDVCCTRGRLAYLPVALNAHPLGAAHIGDVTNHAHDLIAGAACTSAGDTDGSRAASSQYVRTAAHPRC